MAAEDFPPLEEILLEFRAGKMFMEGTRVIPDTRKGAVRIGRGDEGLTHFQWLDRSQNKVEDDQIVFPDEAVYEKVNQSSDRVYILKFKTDNRKFFFWMQEPLSEGLDLEMCNLVNYHISRPIDFGGEEEAEVSVPQRTSEVSEDMHEDDVSSRAGNLVISHASDMAGAVTSGSGPVQLADLQRILSSIQPADPYEGLGISDILKPELIMPLMEELPIKQRLAPFLPEGQWTPKDIIELLQSPPFHQQVEAFTHVLRTGEIDLSQFEIDPSKFKLTVLSFLEALEDSVTGTPEEAEPRDDDKGSSS
ncbi:hypothetical protein QJS10_CPA02g01599 [Acorus calamus]|uniref:Regulatory particle non-ATPase 13 n=1 Tax=Acorus calamus TaxID=4465 RepID=A0AAV9FFV0_ACOCL|nr:hypothetical protein QJS10_CPA02g01599 [Acorus calamus]